MHLCMSYHIWEQKQLRNLPNHLHQQKIKSTLMDKRHGGSIMTDKLSGRSAYITGGNSV